MSFKINFDTLIWSIKIYIFYRDVLEDDNILKLEPNGEIVEEKPCVITAYSPIEDFNKHLEDGVDSAIGIYVCFDLNF